MVGFLGKRGLLTQMNCSSQVCLHMEVEGGRYYARETGYTIWSQDLALYHHISHSTYRRNRFKLDLWRGSSQNYNWSNWMTVVKEYSLYPSNVVGRFHLYPWIKVWYFIIGADQKSSGTVFCTLIRFFHLVWYRTVAYGNNSVICDEAKISIPYCIVTPDHQISDSPILGQPRFSSTTSIHRSIALNLEHPNTWKWWHLTGEGWRHVVTSIEGYFCFNLSQEKITKWA